MLPTEIQLTLRIPKGSPLTASELDTNFSNLRTAILGVSEELQGARVVIGDEPPPGERVGVLWVPTAAREGIYRWDIVDSQWVQVVSPKLYNVTGGTGDAFTLAVAWPFNTYSEMTGRPILMKADRNSTGAATLNINATGAIALKKVTVAGVTDIETGDIRTGGLYLVVLDGSVFHLLNPTPQTPPTYPFSEIYTPPAQALPTANGILTFTSTTTGEPKLTRIVLLCQTDNSVFVAGDEIDLSAVFQNNGDDQWPVTVLRNGHDLKLLFSAAYLTVADGGIGGVNLTNRLHWLAKVTFYA